MSNTFARSPYIIRINETGQTNTKVEIFLHTGSVPTNPQHTLSKVIPSVTNPTCEYNVSPFARTAITHLSPLALYDSLVATPVTEYTQMRVKKYANGVNFATENHYFFDGYGYYQDGANPFSNSVHLTEGKYQYWYDVLNSVSTDTNLRAGNITIQAGTGWYARYTNLSTGATTDVNLTNDTVVDIHRVKGSNYAVGNRVQIFNGADVEVADFTFEPVTECKYTPVRVDFVNRFGAWQREWFFKSKTNNISTTSSTFNLMAQDTNYDTSIGQRREFNLDGTETVRLNTGFVDEFYGTVMRELILSERILVDGYPVIRKTTDFTPVNKIDQKLINYTVEFTYAFDILNSIQ